VLLCSSTEGKGIPEIWDLITSYTESARADGSFEKRRTRQNLNWLRRRIEYLLTTGFYRDARIKRAYQTMERRVLEQKMSPFRAAAELLRIYRARGEG
jgi:LAO/AO transport system kinase